MKRITLITFLSIVVFCSRAQLTGGGERKQTQSPEPVKTTTDENRWTSLNFGLSSPMGDYGDNSVEQPFERAVGAGNGIFFGVTGVRNFTPSNNPFQIGLSSQFSTDVNFTKWDQWIPGAEIDSKVPFLKLDLTLGPAVSYEVVSDLHAEGFLRFGAVLGIGGSATWDDSNFTEFYTEAPAISFGTAFGFGMRYQDLRMTMSFHPTTQTHEYTLYQDSGSSVQEYELPMSTFRLGIGVLL